MKNYETYLIKVKTANKNIEKKIKSIQTKNIKNSPECRKIIDDAIKDILNFLHKIDWETTVKDTCENTNDDPDAIKICLNLKLHSIRDDINIKIGKLSLNLDKMNKQLV